MYYTYIFNYDLSEIEKKIAAIEFRVISQLPRKHKSPEMKFHSSLPTVALNYLRVS